MHKIKHSFYRCKQFLREVLLADDPNYMNKRVGVPLGCKTRWGTHEKQFLSLHNRKKPILQVMKNIDAAEYIDSDLREYVGDRVFWRGIENIVDVMEPLTIALRQLEANTYV